MIGLLLTIAATYATAAPKAIPPPDRASPEGVVRVVGTPQMRDVVALWADALRERDPSLRLDVDLRGSDVGFAALTSGRADIALLGRDATDPEAKAYEWVYRAKPSSLALLHGSLDRAGRSPAPVLFVHRDNPLASLTLAQVEAAFGEEHRRSAANARTWGDLGLDGDWAARPITLYAPQAESGTGRFVRAAVLGGSTRLHWARLTEFAEPVLPAGRVDDAGARALAALANDRGGLAIAHHAADAPANVRALPLAVDTASPAITASPDTLRDGTYPLARTLRAYVHRADDRPLDPQVARLLALVLSDAGQSPTSEDHGYLPLGDATLADQRRTLDAWK